MPVFDSRLWRCFFRLLAAAITRNWEAFDNVVADVEAIHTERCDY